MRLLIALVLTAFCATGVAAQNSILWKVTPPGGGKASYLFGTNHAQNRSFLNSLPAVVAAIRQSDVVITESDAGPSRARKSDRPAAYDYSKVFDAKDLAYLRALFPEETPPEKLSRFEILHFLELLTQRRICLGISDSDRTVLDREVMLLGIREGKAYTWLETDSVSGTIVRNINSYVSNDAFAMQAMLAIERLRSGNREFTPCTSADAYKELRVDDPLETECPEKGFEATLITRRNLKWLLVLPEKMQAQACFVAVGLRHLYARCGLVMQLRDLGFRVEPVAPR